MSLVLTYFVFIAVSSVAGCLMSLARGVLTAPLAWAALGAGFAAALWFFVKYRAENFSSVNFKSFGFWTWAAMTVFLIFILKEFLWYAYPKDADLCVGLPNNLSDSVLHICHIKYFASGARFWPDNPILANHKLYYPIGMDFFNSLLALAGVNVIRGIVWVGILSSLALLVALLRWGRGFTLAGFLFNGGLLGFLFFRQWAIPHALMFDLSWKNLIQTLFICQRGFSFALPVGLLLLSSWRERFFTADAGAKGLPRVMPFWMEVLFYAVMPFFHIHTFLYLSLLLFVWFIFWAPARRAIARLWGFAFAFPAVFLFFITDHFRMASMIHWKAGWEQGTGRFLPYWLSNFGLFPVLVFWLLAACLFKIQEQRVVFRFSWNSRTAFVFPAVSFFVLFFNVMPAAWDWDAIKMLLWSYLILLPYVWDGVLKGWRMIVRVPVLFVLFFSGMLVVGGNLLDISGYPIFKLAELNEVESAVKGLPIDARFACYSTYNHALLYAGRKVALGYSGWIFSHGFFAKLDATNRKLDALMMGAPPWRAMAKDLGVRYIFWGEKEKSFYRNSSRPWEQEARKVFSSASCEIYDLNKP